MIDKYFLISFECISSIGDSLEKESMLKTFLRVCTKKTAAYASMAIEKNSFKLISSVNQKGINFDYNSIDLDSVNSFEIIKNFKEANFIVLDYQFVYCIFEYSKEIEDLEILANMLVSFKPKLVKSLEACISFEESKNIKNRLELAIEGSNDGLWDWDLLTNEVYFSPRWKSMLGYEKDELEDNFDTWLSKVHPEDKEHALESVHNYLEGKSDIFENIHRLKHKNGHWVWVLDRGKAMFENSRPIRMVGFHTDISKQKELEEQLAVKVLEEVAKNKEKDQMLVQQSRLAQMGEMISMIAHQWRQPLASISSVAVSLKLKIALGKFDLSTLSGQESFLENLEHELNDIEEFVDTLTHTIDDFRNFYKDDKNKVNASIDEPLKRALNIVKPQMDTHAIIIKEDFQTKTSIELFENELLQVFLNIFKNAIDNFIDKQIEKPTISIRTEDILDKIIVTICDNGGGIDESIIDMIFDPYFSTKDKKNGTGLGLYMSKTIVEKHHGGKLTVKNKNGGACFYVVIDK